MRGRHTSSHTGWSTDAGSREQILARCARWDRIFAEVQTSGRLRTRSEERPDGFRERGGIGLHVGPDGRLFKGRDGHHRFAMALALGLPVIPAMVGVVHRSALRHLPALRVA